MTVPDDGDADDELCSMTASRSVITQCHPERSSQSVITFGVIGFAVIRSAVITQRV
jgi:hypothetical protein